MPSDGALLMAGYLKVDNALAAKGAPRTPVPWLGALRDFWLSGAFRMVVRKGRQVFASTCVAPRVAVTHAQFGEYPEQARGTRGTIALFSTRQKEVDERLFNIERVFYDLGIKVKVRGDVIEVPKRPIIIQSFPATSDAARGGNYLAIWQDEMPAWRNDSGANPAAERDAATVPGCATHPNARAYSVGTPMGSSDYHAQLVDRGDTETQRVFVGPSWYWNPTLTEQRCRELQPDPILFEREFGARPQDDGIRAFLPDHCRRMVRDLQAEAEPIGAACLVIDSSSGRGDGFAWAVVSYVEEPSGVDRYLMRDVLDPKTGKLSMRTPRHDNDPSPEVREALEIFRMLPNMGSMVPNPAYRGSDRRLLVSDVGAFEGQFASSLSLARIVEHIASVGQASGVRRAFGDQHLAFALESEFGRHGIHFEQRPWTLPAKVEAVATGRRLMREGAIVVEASDDGEKLAQELLEIEEKFTETGALTVRAKRTLSGHADRAMLFLLIARLESEGEIRGSPIEAARGMRWRDAITHESGTVGRF